MREYRFRGLGVDGNWHYGESTPAKLPFHSNLATFFANAHVDAIRPETIGEWTGLKDKKTLTDIYEGDIVQFRYGNRKEYVIAKVRWAGTGYDLLGKYPTEQFTNSWGSKYLSHELCEVIGNIWEHPELLENKE